MFVDEALPKASPILAAARELAAIWAQYGQLDEMHRATSESAELARIDRWTKTVIARKNAIETLIATSPATTLSEAAVQLALANGHVDALQAAAEERCDLLDAVARLVDSAVAVIVRESGIDPKAHGMIPYAKSAIEGAEWPPAGPITFDRRA